MKTLLLSALCFSLAGQTVTVSSNGASASANLTPGATPVAVTLPTPTAIVTAQLSSIPVEITLPVEVMGPAGTTATSTFVLSTVPSGQIQLYAQIHGLSYDSEASVQVNQSVWLPISTATLTLQGLASAYGGIGGGFRTIALTLPLPPGAVTTGINTVTFRFNGTDGLKDGFRVLAFNIRASGQNLIPASAFLQADPTSWQPPLNDAADIAAGLSLWQTAALSDPASGVAVPIKAHCADCHASDGRDLKYFNYSNLSIESRAAFHGLSAQQGRQIASYIRSLNVPNPGRPWNPPYQPGPGLDSQPVANWAAGAGLSAVLATDADMQPYIPAAISATGYLNMRETPIAMQLPDWNAWLPMVSPIDAFGAEFTTSTFYTTLPAIRTALQSSTIPQTAYKNATQTFSNWDVAQSRFYVTIQSQIPASWTPALRQAYDSVGLWGMVKMWELNQTFGLEGMPQVIYGAKADARGWRGAMPFNSSPAMQHVPTGPGIGNGSQATFGYLASAWYQTQLILNDGQGGQLDHNPMDYGYVFGDIANLCTKNATLPCGNLQLADSIKALQEFTQSAIPPSNPVGWHPINTSPFWLVTWSDVGEWSDYTPQAKAAILTAFTQAWFAQASTYTPAQYYAGGSASASDDPATLNWGQTFGGTVWYMLPRLRFEGVPASLTTKISAWAATIWPKGNWALNDAAVCTAISGAQNSCTANGQNIF